MRLAVLGGTVFLSRAVAAEALSRGHEVVCACRGASGSVPAGARLVQVDRASEPLPDLGPIDAVVDVARQPSWVRSAVDALADAHWVFVSTINVYADEATPGGRPETVPVREPLSTDGDATDDPDAYGRMKVACEQTVLDGAASATVVRPGLIIGPGDPTGRFSYWPRRLSRVGEAAEMVAPGDPADLVQVIDVRDLAAWLIELAERRVRGVYDGVGPAMPIAQLLAETADGLGVAPRWTWLPSHVLDSHDIQPWAGPDSIPLWLPRPQYDGMLAHDVAPPLEAGLRLRPVGDTARDTLAWLDSDPDAPVTGIELVREHALLTAHRDSPSPTDD